TRVACKDSGHSLDVANAQGIAICECPIEQLDEESGHGGFLVFFVERATPVGTLSFVDRKRYVCDLVFFIESVKLVGRRQKVGAQHISDIGLTAAFLWPPQRLHHQRPGVTAGFGLSPRIVKSLRPVDGEADTSAGVPQEVDPFAGNSNSVRLDTK